MLDSLTLDQLRIFIAVAETGSFRAAAARLRRVQSAVSHSIANLEGELRVMLFDRSGHRPELTPQGKALLADARATVQRMDFLKARARGLGEGVELGLALALDPLFPHELAARALGQMHETYPSVAVRIWDAPLGEAIAALREKRCTLALTTIEVPDPAVEVERLALASPVALTAVAAATHPLARRSLAGEVLTAQDLSDHLQIVVEDPSPITRGKDFGVFSAGTWRVSDMAIKRSLILSGLGWGGLPDWSIARELAEGRLVRVRAAALGPNSETQVRAYLAHRSDEALGPAAQCLRGALRGDGRTVS